MRHRKGERGGLRVIYYYLAADPKIWFFTLYDKDEAADLMTEEAKVLKGKNGSKDGHGPMPRPLR